MGSLFEIMCTIWAFAGCLFGLVVIIAIFKGAIDMFAGWK